MNFGVVSPEERRNVGSRLVDRLDQLRDPWWHHQEVHGFRLAGVAIEVRDAAASQSAEPASATTSSSPSRNIPPSRANEVQDIIASEDVNQISVKLTGRRGYLSALPSRGC